MDPNEEKIRQFLKKSIKVDINKQPTLEEKQEFIKRKLFAEETFQHTFQKQTVFDRLKNAAFSGYGFFRQRKFKQFMRDTFPFLAFLTFSTWIIYKMELQFDKMNQSVFKVKTIKEQEIEKENNYIAKALRGEKFSAQENQITDVPDKRNKYKFEEMEGDEPEFDTREDFLEGLLQDYNQGLTIPDEYKEQVYEYAQREGKDMGFGRNLSQNRQVIDNESNEEGIDLVQKKQTTKPQTIKRKTKKPALKEDDMGYDGFGPSTVN